MQAQNAEASSRYRDGTSQADRLQPALRPGIRGCR